MKGSLASSPHFSRRDRYSSVGNRAIQVVHTDAILHEISKYLYPGFTGTPTRCKMISKIHRQQPVLFKKKTDSPVLMEWSMLKIELLMFIKTIL